MNGLVARWYAGITRKNLKEYRKDAIMLAERAPAGSAILDLAPGPGYLAIELAKLGNYQVTGLDISETFVDIARQNAKDVGVSVDFRLGDAAEMPFEEETFDYIVCRAAFKNFSQPVAALNEMRRALKAGGRAVIFDLRGDASAETIDQAVDDMGLSAINALITRWIFKNMLVKRAYTKARFNELVSRSEFRTCTVEEDMLGLQVWLKK
jgi:ubiquinone/menaquinone biosynthesis C-methylase UbiE